MRLRIVLAPLLAVSLLPGCAAPPPAADKHAVAIPVPKTKPRPGRAAPPPPPKPLPPADEEPSPLAADAGETIPLQALVGLDEAAVVGVLGAPAGRRREGAAQVWSYGGGACRLDLYFFRDLRSGGMHALAYRLDGPHPPEPACPSAWRRP